MYLDRWYSVRFKEAKNKRSYRLPYFDLSKIMVYAICERDLPYRYVYSMHTFGFYFKIFVNT